MFNDSLAVMCATVAVPIFTVYLTEPMLAVFMFLDCVGMLSRIRGITSCTNT